MPLNQLTSVRLASEEIKEIDQLVKDGMCMSRADFVRDATRKELENIRQKKSK